MMRILFITLFLFVFSSHAKIANIFQSENVNVTYMSKISKKNGDITNSFRVTLYNKFYFQSKITKDYFFGREDQQLKLTVGLFF